MPTYQELLGQQKRYNAAGYGDWRDVPATITSPITQAVHGLGGQDQSAQEELKPKPGESMDEWLARAEKFYPDIRQSLRSLPPEQLAEFQKQFYVDPAQQAAQDKAAKEQADQDAWHRRTQDFYNWATRSPEEMAKDPEVAQLLNHVQSQASRGDRGAGVYGGAANSNLQRTYLEALNGVVDQRRGMGLQVLNSGLNDVQATNTLNEQKRQFDVKGYMDAANNKAQQDAQNANMPWQIGGAVVGGVAGGLAAGPAGIAPGASAGAGLGGAVGGAVNPYRPPSYNPNPGGGYTPSNPYNRGGY